MLHLVTAVEGSTNSALTWESESIQQDNNSLILLMDMLAHAARLSDMLRVTVMYQLTLLMRY